MGDALGSGWLVALLLGIPAFVTAVVVPLSKWIAARWREPLQEEVRARTELQIRLNEALEKLADERLQRIFMEARHEACESELDNWKTGRWKS